MKVLGKPVTKDGLYMLHALHVKQLSPSYHYVVGNFLGSHLQDKSTTLLFIILISHPRLVATKYEKSECKDTMFL